MLWLKGNKMLISGSTVRYKTIRKGVMTRNLMWIFKCVIMISELACCSEHPVLGLHRHFW